jgi:hypothetical protein
VVAAAVEAELQLLVMLGMVVTVDHGEQAAVEAEHPYRESVIVALAGMVDRVLSL